MRKWQAVTLLLFSFAIVRLEAQQHPNLERGIDPKKVYDFLGLDQINLFNGNLNQQIALGPSFEAGPGLAYNFALS